MLKDKNLRENIIIWLKFLIVEITNDGSIQQVHGFANRNASTEPGLTEFVKKCAKERKLKLTNFNKVR
jgi:hypothetical protein